MKKRWLALTMAATLILGSVPTTAFGASFVDLNDAPWDGAVAYLEEAQALGLMSGYLENGVYYCKSRNSVTHSETLQLIYSIMDEAGEVNVSSTEEAKWASVLSAYSVAEWVQPAATYALSEGIIGSVDLGNLGDNSPAADREAVGVIFGKAMATMESIDSSATLRYDDADDISDAAVPYLDLLYDHDVMVGDTDNNFNPNANINRAEMAVLSVSMYNELTGTSFSSTKTAEGTVTSVTILSNDGIFLSILTDAGSSISLTGDEDVEVWYDGDEFSLEDIGKGDEVEVQYSGTTLYEVEILDSAAGLLTAITGELDDLDDDEITIIVDDEEYEFDVSDDVVVKISGSTSTLSKLEKYMDDYTYDVTLSFEDGEVIYIKAILNDNNQLTGELIDLGSSDVTIEYDDEEYEYPLNDDDVDIEYANGNSKTFTSLQNDVDDGYYFQVTLSLDSSGEVDEIIIEYYEDETNGIITYMNSKRIEIEANGETYKYYIDDDDIDVEINGKACDLDDLEDLYDDGEEIRVSLDINRDDGIDEIWAWSSNADMDEAELVSISSSKIEVEYDGDEYEYDLADDVEIEIDDKSISLSTFKAAAKDYEYEVSLSFNSDGEVKEIIGTNTDATFGKLKDIGDDFVKIEAGGVTYTYDLYSSVDITLEGKSADIDDLDDAIDDAYWDDEYVYVELGFRSDAVNEIEADFEDLDDVDDDDYDDSLTGELTYISGSYSYIKLNIGSATVTYSLEDGDDTEVDFEDDSKVDTIEELDEYMDDDLDSDEGIWATIYLNSDYNVFYIKAEVMDEDDIEDELS